jgi:DMSO/TMAO reductase YedYZ molybdopterin-dependent catalytic subunit
LLAPRPVYVSWGESDIGTYQWTGTSLRPLLEEAGVLDDAVEVLFTGWDSGVDLGVEHAFERSMPVADALRPEVMLAWAANGEPLLPVHGFPLRLIVPSWYGMASVKWLRSITVLREPFQGVQQMQAYRFRQSRDEAGEPVREKRVMSVMLPPGVPDLISQCRFVAPGQQELEGKAWSGSAPIAKVEVSVDAGKTWVPSLVTRVSNDPDAWVRWQAIWDATEGDYSVMCRATDAAGNVQPDDAQTIWNAEGNGINAVRAIKVFVRDGIGTAAAKAPCTPREILPGAKVPPVPQ